MTMALLAPSAEYQQYQFGQLSWYIRVYRVTTGPDGKITITAETARTASNWYLSDGPSSTLEEYLASNDVSSVGGDTLSTGGDLLGVALRSYDLQVQYGSALQSPHLPAPKPAWLWDTSQLRLIPPPVLSPVATPMPGQASRQAIRGWSSTALSKQIPTSVPTSLRRRR